MTHHVSRNGFRNWVRNLITPVLALSFLGGCAGKPADSDKPAPTAKTPEAKPAENALAASADKEAAGTESAKAPVAGDSKTAMPSAPAKEATPAAPAELASAEAKPAAAPAEDKKDDGSLVPFGKGNHVLVIGNTLAERMQHGGSFEARLHLRNPDKQLVVRNLGWSADELTLRPRSKDYQDHGANIADHKPDVLIAAFGFNESFGGSKGLPKFEKDLAQFIDETKATKYNGTNAPLIVLLSPIPHEDLKRPELPDGKATNANIKMYMEAMKRISDEKGVVFIDLFGPMEKKMAEAKEPLTINGIHLNEAGDKALGEVLDAALYPGKPLAATADQIEKVRREVLEKNLQHWYDYRSVNGYYIYGGRKQPFGVVNFPEEFAKLRKMVAVRDQRIWDAANGKELLKEIDDSSTGTLTPIVTNFKEEVKLTSPEDTLKTFTHPDGVVVELFASEKEFPDLQKPCQFTFDDRNRLWVCTMPSYPQYLPGTPVDDKILILEDTDGDGKADKQTVFADGLHLPTGIELGYGGVFVAQQPNLMFLKDTDGDDKADVRKIVLHGFDSADSHHSISAFEWGPGGGLYFQEGTFHHTQVETPWGPRRGLNAAVYRYDPRTEKFDVFVNYPFANPWGHVFNGWGQDFVADASSGQNYYAAAFSGDVDYPNKHSHMDAFLKKQWRPTSGCEIVSSRNFPDEAQGDYVLNNCIGFQGVLQYHFKDEGSGYHADPVPPLVKSSDLNFRPVDLQFGLDGVLYLCDWYNPLIGHMQHSLRDPNRDKSHGRIWRVRYENRPLVPLPKIHGATTAELLALFAEPEIRTHYALRRELAQRDTKEVIAATNKWLSELKDDDKNHDRFLLEGLWIHQAHDQVNVDLLEKVLRAKDPRARAAATRVLCFWRDRVPDVFGKLQEQINDENPQVRLEAVRALSFFSDPQAAKIAADLLQNSMDYYLKYTFNETLDTLGRRLGAPAVVGPLTQALESGKLAAPAVQETITQLCKRGDADTLGKVYAFGVASEAVSPVVRSQTLGALESTAVTRKLRPKADLTGLAKLLSPDAKGISDGDRIKVVQLVATWKVGDAAPALLELVRNSKNANLRKASFDALVQLGDSSKDAIAELAAGQSPPAIRAQALAALLRLDPNVAYPKIAELFAKSNEKDDMGPLLSAVLNQQEGTQKLAVALEKVKVPTPVARNSLSFLYSVGRGDAELIKALASAGNIVLNPDKLSDAEFAAVVEESRTKGDAKKGEMVFRRVDLACSKCHSLNGVGGNVGPDLRAVGSSSPPDYLLKSLLNPSEAIKEEYLTAKVLTVDGEVFEGIVVEDNDDRLVLKNADAKQTVIAKDDIEERTKGNSLMPEGLVKLLTHEELVDLVRFLSELGKPGDYAITETPTIRRWRAMTNPSERLIKEVPDTGVFLGEVMDNPKAEWVPVYSKFDGNVPLDELTKGRGLKTIYLQGELDVAKEGPILVEIAQPRQGITLWMDDAQIQVRPRTVVALTAGRHKITLRIDPKVHKGPSVKVDLAPEEAGKPLEVKPVGGT